jgi:hypothetical protein
MKAVQSIRPAYIILGLLVVFFGKTIFPSDGNFIGGRDIVDQGYWGVVFIKEQFLSGSIPLWNPYYYCGHPFVANPTTCVFYPLTLLFYVALPSPWAINLDTLVHVYLAAMGMYCFVFLITQSKSAGLAAAIVYSLSGYHMDRIYAGHLLAIRSTAFLAWIFYFIEKAYRTEKPIFFLISGLLLGLRILSGDPQNSYYTALFLALYFLVRYLSTPRALRPKPFHRLGLFFCVIPLVAFGVSAVQILPSLEFLSYSDRAKNTYEFATLFSFPLKNFFTFLVPKPPTHPAVLNTNWEFAGYLGVLAVFLAAIGGVFSKRRQYTLCFGIILCAAITIMLGSNTPLYQFYFKWIPGMSTFRVPARCLIIAVFSMAVFVGVGFQRLCESPLTIKQHSCVMIGFGIIFIGLFWGAKAFQIPLASREMLLGFGLTISAALILTLVRSLRSKHAIAGLVIAGLFIDLYLIYPQHIPIINQNELLKKHDYEILFEKDPGYYRVMVPSPTLTGLASRGMKFHYYGVNGYTNIVINDFFKFVHEMANLPVPALARHTFNPRLFQRNLVFSSKILGVKYAITQGRAGYELWDTSQVMPRAVLVRDAVILPRLEDHLAVIKRPDFDPQQQVVLQKAFNNGVPAISKPEQGSTKEDVVRITQYCANRIKLRSFSEHDTYLVLSELFYPGWYAYVDGNEVPILRADYILRAIPLTPGQHDIVFVFRPMSFFVGAAISVLTLFLLGGYCLMTYKKKITGDSSSAVRNG